MSAGGEWRLLEWVEGLPPSVRAFSRGPGPPSGDTRSQRRLAARRCRVRAGRNISVAVHGQNQSPSGGQAAP